MFITYLVLKLHALVHLSGETVDEESALAITPAVIRAVLSDDGGHGVLEESDGDFHGDNLTLSNVRLDQFTILRTFSDLFSTKEIAG